MGDVLWHGEVMSKEWATVLTDMAKGVDSKACTKCGRTQPLGRFHRGRRAKDGRQAQCKDCRRVANREFRTRPERREPDRENNRAWAKANPKKNAESKRRYAQKNPEVYREATRRYRKANSELVKERKRARYRANKEHARLEGRENMRGRAVGRGPDEMAYATALRDDPCSYCGDRGGHVDHIEPRALGGWNRWDNLTAACRSCNSSKNAMPLLFFMAREVA